MNKIYLLIEEDDFIGNDYEVFVTYDSAKFFFEKKLSAHLSCNGTDNSRNYAKCIEKGQYDEDGYHLGILEKNVKN